MNRPTIPLLATTLLLAAGGCHLPGRALRGYAEADPEGMELLEPGGGFEHAPPEIRGQVRLVFDDFGSMTTDVLETYGMPWKLVAAALVLDRHRSEGSAVDRGTLQRALSGYGFLRPTRIANWEGPQPRLERPLGLIAGTASRGFPAVEIEIANFGCATCHAGPLFGADGRPTGEAWLGLPNASIDLSRYGDDVFVALRAELERPDTLLAAVVTLFPDVSERELSTLRKHVVPRARERLAERAELYGGVLPFENGGPGLNNGAASLRFLMGRLHGDARAGGAAWASAPDLYGTTLRRALLADAVYAPPGRPRFGPLTAEDVTDAHLGELAGVASLFVMGTQGASPEQARAAIPAVHDVLRFVHSSAPPRFPGPIDEHLAAAGAGVYGEACATCHGRYSPGLSDVRLVEHPNRLTAQDRMLTDSTRWATADRESLTAVERELGYGRHIEALATGGYVAPDLSGVWATAPYLHNGSVPTLWHLLHPEERPERFQVGGHELDYDLVGIAGTPGADGTWRYRPGYTPWSTPMLYDTREPGRSNAGHGFGDLTEVQRRALLEYMKVL